MCSDLAVDVQVRALAVARLARPPRQVVLAVVHDRVAAEDDVAELVLAQRAHAVHHPAHAERRADLFGLPGAGRARADHFLQRDDVGVDVAQHLDDARRVDAAIHAAAAMDVVGGDADVDVTRPRTVISERFGGGSRAATRSRASRWRGRRRTRCGTASPACCQAGSRSRRPRSLSSTPSDATARYSPAGSPGTVNRPSRSV